MIKNYQLITRFVVILVFFILTACSNSRVPGAFPTPHLTPVMAAGGAAMGAIAGSTTHAAPVGAVIGGAVGGLIGLYADSRMSLMDKLRADGIQVVQLGSNVRIIVPTDKFFDLGTPNLNEAHEMTLQNLAALLKLYGNTQITVSGYTDDVMDPQQALMVSSAQANSLVAYLWAHGIPFQYLYPVGRGMQCPIAQNSTVVGSAMNRRIEVSLRTA